MENFENTKRYDDHIMICNDTICHEVNNPLICHDSNERLSKDEWWYLVNQLDEWRVFNPRAIVKKNPAAAWKCMNICKDKGVRVPGAYFTTCFRNELSQIEFRKKLEAKLGVA